jgi:hypothetical protein
MSNDGLGIGTHGKRAHVWLFSNSCTPDFAQALARMFPDIKKSNATAAASIDTHFLRGEEAVVIVVRSLVETLEAAMAQRADPRETLVEWKRETARLLSIYHHNWRGTAIFLMD